MYEKRKGVKAVTQDLRKYLNESQLAELHRMECFGWSLIYLRRPLFQEPVAVLAHDQGNAVGVLDVEGKLNLQAELRLRTG